MSVRRGDVDSPLTLSTALPSVLKTELVKPLDLDAGSIVRVTCPAGEA